MQSRIGIGRHRIHIILVAEYDAEFLGFNQFFTKDPLAGLVATFNKRITLKVCRHGTRIVDFDPTRIVTLFIKPIQINRRNFAYHQGRITLPFECRIGRDIKRVVHDKGITCNRVNRLRRFNRWGNRVNFFQCIAIFTNDNRRLNLCRQIICMLSNRNNIFVRRTGHQTRENQTKASPCGKTVLFIEYVHTATYKFFPENPDFQSHIL